MARQAGRRSAIVHHQFGRIVASLDTGGLEEGLEETSREHRSGGVSKFIRSSVREIVTTILPAVLLALFVNAFMAEAALVEEGPSMQQLRVAAGA